MNDEKHKTLNQFFSDDQIDVLDEIGINLEALCLMRGRRIHDFMVSNDAFTDGEFLIDESDEPSVKAGE